MAATIRLLKCGSGMGRTMLPLRLGRVATVRLLSVTATTRMETYVDAQAGIIPNKVDANTPEYKVRSFSRLSRSMCLC